jgi:hypothetical protein
MGDSTIAPPHRVWGYERGIDKYGHDEKKRRNLYIKTGQYIIHNTKQII